MQDRQDIGESRCEAATGEASRTVLVSHAIGRALEKVIGLPATVIVTACVGILAVMAVFSTGYSQIGGEIETMSVLSEFGSAGPVRQLVVPALVALLEVAFLILARPLVRRSDTRRVVVASLAVALLVQVAWSMHFMTGDYFFNDTVQIDIYARALVDGDMSKFVSVDEWVGDVNGDAPSYLLRVPYQSGMIWLFAAIYKVFGAGNYCAIQWINIFANLVSVASVIGIVAETSGDEDEPARGMMVKLCAIMSALFLPFLMSAPFVYSNAIAFSFIMVACYLSARAWARRSWGSDLACLAGTTVLMFVGIMLKQTFLIFAIVVALCWVLHALREGRPILIVPVVLMSYACLHACDLPIWCLEQVAGVRLGEGQPLFANVTIGLTWAKSGNAPGWYGATAIDCYNQTGGSMEAQKVWCSDYIRERLGEMVADPGYAFYFFRYKITSEWLDPSWQSCWFSACAFGPNGPTSLIGRSAFSIYESNKYLLAFLDGMQTVFYGLAAIGFASEVKRAKGDRSPIGYMLVVGLSLAGLLVYLLWEAQAMYTLPFAFAMLPMVAKGCLLLYDFVDRRATSRHGTVSKTTE